MRLERLTRGHAVAAVAALVLLVIMAMTWYGTTRADLAHHDRPFPMDSGRA